MYIHYLEVVSVKKKLYLIIICTGGDWMVSQRAFPNHCVGESLHYPFFLNVGKISIIWKVSMPSNQKPVVNASELSLVDQFTPKADHSCVFISAKTGI